MKKNVLIILTLVGVSLVSCDNKKKQSNPLLAEWNTPYQMPPFDQIKNEHYQPAIKEAIEKQQEEIKAIAENADTPDFANTIEALESSGKDLKRITRVFYNVKNANGDEELQKIAEELAPVLSKNSDDIFLNEKLFARIKSVNENGEITSQLKPEQKQLLKKTYTSFVRNGANLPEEKKERLRKINSEIALLTLKFGNNVLNETNNYTLVVADESRLAGLPTPLIETAAKEAENRDQKGKWVFTLNNSSVMPFLQYAEDRELRQEIWNAYQLRGNNDNAYDNKESLLKIANLRLEKANILGYKSHAAYVLEESMSKTPEGAMDLLNQLWQPALQKAKNEAADIQKLMQQDGIQGDVTPADWRYYSEKIRQQRYDFDENQMQAYFSLENTREGIFMVTEKLYGLKFEQLNDVPVYHEDVTAWKVTEKDGREIGVLLMDMHPRATKNGGAWMTSYRPQSTVNGERIKPIISIVCNFTQPTDSTPALLTFDEVTTFFHEFGHALHGLLSDVQYESLAGTSVPRDFVELPSQIMENWAEEPEVLKMFAKHYQTGETIPDEMIEKMKATGTFNQGFATTEYLAASILDMMYHAIEEPLEGDVVSYEINSMKQAGLTDAIIPRYRSTYFNHIFSGGYSAGYYSYIWSEVLDSDAFEAFKSTSLFDPENAASFRKNILERGGTQDPEELYVNFRGKKPSIEPLLKKRGLDIEIKDKQPEINLKKL
ncbi:M3 family metallopeptidase [Avrilella dinanensis]|uniref:Peptidase M3 n=1 Tax=Avrilella dinanensis TaxID=2008672 RepID=A0A2M9R756_9FLAO|nr:M3 family metallopeptidase [Avrilella dinanensis]PJR04689.1 peptidase M3 [Avrilella dinanensis]